jgi:hypothetical protein
MKQRAPSKTAAARWASQLNARVEQVLALHPEADRDNVRHTLILLEQPPLERLQRSLIRGRAMAALQARRAARKGRARTTRVCSERAAKKK